MKKNFLSKLMLLASASLLMLNACQKDNTNTAAKLGKATLTGYAYINSNLKNDTSGAVNQGYEYVNEGTVIYASHPASDLVLNSDGSNADIIDSTTVKSDGSYTLTFQANPNITKNISVHLYANDMRLTPVQVDPKTVADPLIYSLSTNASFKYGTVKIQDIYFYSSNEVK